MYPFSQIQDYTYKFKIDVNSPIAIFVSKLISTSYFDKLSSSIIITAENVVPLKRKFNSRLTNSQRIKLIDCLTKQILMTKELGYGFYGINIEDIIAIDDYYFIFNEERMKPIENDMFTFIQPFTKPYFSSPEIYKLTTLPSQINYKCSFYSLGLLIAYSLLYKPISIDDDIEEQLKPLHKTTFYWFIKRCINDNIDKRTLLLI